jgi:tetratricopeptide (TPR) repeat protein
MSTTIGAGRARVPDWQKMVLDVGVLSEPVREDGRVVFWIPTDRDAEYQYWERVGTAARAEIKLEGGVCSIPVTSTRARQKIAVGLFGKLARKLTGGGGNDSWILPSGQPVERCGDRKTDLVLAWPEDESASIDEATVQSRWPGPTRCRRVANGLFLLSGLGGEAAKGPAARAVPSGVVGTEEVGCPVAMAEQFLEAARQSGDRSREAGALTDLGIVVMNEGDLNKSVAHLDKAATLARELGDGGREADALCNLGYALLALGQSPTAKQVLERALTLTRQIQDAYTEKLVLERLGMAHANLRDPNGALSLFNKALEMTRAAGDRQQETRILWTRAIAYADMNRRDEAIACAEESVDLLRKLGKPEASWYGAQLQRYRMDLSGLGIQGSGGQVLAGPMGAGVSTVNQPGADQSTGPGLLRMAVSATKAMMKYIGSGLKATPADLQQKRIATCRACEHHTGIRCRICGCFTNVKTRMAHEQCPIGKWPG